MDRKIKCMIAQSDEPIHSYFGLSYDSFVVLHRSIMQSMPVDWQSKMAVLLMEADEAAADLPGMPERYSLIARDERGRIVKDPYLDYERGRRRLPLVLGEGGAP